MKRFLIVCAMALAATVIFQTRANAWSNFHVNNNFTMGFQSGGNRFLWGAFRGDQYPIVTTPQGFATYPSPYGQGSHHPWLMQKMMMEYQQMCAGYGGGMGNPYAMNPMMMGGYGPQMQQAMMPYGGMQYGGMPYGGMQYGGNPQQFPQYFGTVPNNFWAPGMAMYPQAMQQQQMMPPQMQQQMAGYPMMPQQMMQQQMAGYPMMMPPPTMYYGGPAVPVNPGTTPANPTMPANQGNPVQLVPHMPHAQDSQPVGNMPPANAQQIGYVWENPFVIRGQAPSYWGN